jgi:hypothetical protein
MYYRQSLYLKHDGKTEKGRLTIMALLAVEGSGGGVDYKKCGFLY